MTAEVAILNGSGVALAADSAVTVAPTNKIFASVEKLFQLSFADPIGLMICGNAEFVGVPWETVIKTYRREHGDTSFSTVSGHAESFLDFIRNHPDLFPADVQRDFAVQFAISISLAIIREAIESLRGSGVDFPTPDEIRAAVSSHASNALGRTVGAPRCVGASDDLIRMNRRALRAPIREGCYAATKKRPVDNATLRRLVHLALLALPRAVMPGRSQLVFAGFGAKEYFPAVRSYSIDGWFAGELRLVQEQTPVVGRENPSALIPFAQSEVVQLFMEGIDIRLRADAENAIRAVAESAVQAVANSIPGLAAGASSQVIEAIKRAAVESTDRLRTAIRRFAGPIVTNIQSLPKDELAAMAEAFVNLTKFRRRVSTDQETVGGPIDVAVITKGDGFVWIKRKHYFEAVLNPRILAGYHR